SQPVAAQQKDQDPSCSADNVETEKSPIFHSADARHEGRERANDRDEASQNAGLAAVLLVEELRPNQMFLVEKAGTLGGEHARPDPEADEIIHRVSQNSRRNKQDD